MKKPRRKLIETKIVDYDIDNHRRIWLVAEKEIAQEITATYSSRGLNSTGNHGYMIEVDRHYDFKEVVEHIESCQPRGRDEVMGKTKRPPLENGEREFLLGLLTLVSKHYLFVPKSGGQFSPDKLPMELANLRDALRGQRQIHLIWVRQAWTEELKGRK